ncbi:hypothetical protein PPSIR1_20994 [Plesiocystis pacifica SIR-1]|uniref:Uncharacterized protein n=1 Tax=Plesiocystis pacifica SIR-1 TaxID=391625 RepID=A6G3D8_9BACT|nr:hypothetical protein [Plesiocystis pacifica]EDM79545.1 hypothetical protein PPSIR1_20994 [Plesiocystis pacifica SIR-1]
MTFHFVVTLNTPQVESVCMGDADDFDATLEDMITSTRAWVMLMKMTVGPHAACCTRSLDAS